MTGWFSVRIIMRLSGVIVLVAWSPSGKHYEVAMIVHCQKSVPLLI